MSRLLLSLLLCFPCFLPAADIVAPESVPAYELVDLSTKSTGKGFAWFVTGPDGFAKVRVDSGDRSKAWFTGRPGKYNVMLVVSLDDGTLDQGQAIITIGEVVVTTPPTTTPPTTTPPTTTPPVEPAPATKVSAATYVVERGTIVHPAVQAAINDLNRKGILATLVYASTTDGTGEGPAQYKAAIAAAKEAGLPALVTLNAEHKVIKTTRNPTTQSWLEITPSIAP